MNPISEPLFSDLRTAELALKATISACIIHLGLLFFVLRFPPRNDSIGGDSIFENC